MDEYQKSITTQFFEPYPKLSPSSCHEFALNHIALAIFPNSPDAVDIRPSSFQGSLSYTAILASRQGQQTIVQFRAEQQDLSTVVEANRIHGSLAPLVTFRGMYDDLFVYTAPFIEGKPYIQCLLSSDEDDLPLSVAMASLLDIADVLTQGIRPNDTSTERPSLLDGITSQALSYSFRSSNLRINVLTCINKISLQLRDLNNLPLAFTHQDLSPFNYLIDESTGRVQAVLDWDGARYLVLGSNFHFIESFFGSMTQDGWIDNENRSQLETTFYVRISDNLVSQGYGKLEQAQLELPKALGMLHYYLKRMTELKDALNELYLHAHLQRLTFMNGCMLPTEDEFRTRRQEMSVVSRRPFEVEI